MQEFITLTDTILFYALFTAFLVAGLWKASEPSVMYALVMVFLAEFFMLGAFDPFVWSLTDREWQNFLWFNGFAAIELSCAWALMRLHRVHQVALSFPAKSTIIGYLVLSFLQVFTYLDHVYAKVGVFTALYPFIVPAISSSISLILLTTVSKEIIQRMPGYQQFMSKNDA